MRNPDLIPVKDEDFATFTNHFIEIISASYSGWSLPLTRVTALQTAHAAFNDAWLVARNKNTRTTVQVTQKREAREVLESLLRPFIQQFIKFNNNISDAERVMLGIKPRKLTRTRATPPDTVPQVSISYGSGNAILVYFRQQADAAGCSRRAMPKGVRYIDIRMKTGSKPASPAECFPFGIVTRSPLRLQYEPQQRGKEVHLYARWGNLRGTGGWSKMQSFIMV